MTKQTPERFKNTEQVWVQKSELINARIAFALTIIALALAVGTILMFLIRGEC